MIETERLRLIPLTVDYLDEFVALHAEPKVARYLRPLDREQALKRLQDDRRDWAERGHGLLAVLDRTSGQFLGRAALKYSWT